MPSPFPGMDPYLETPALWSDFGARFITYLGDALMDCGQRVPLEEELPPADYYDLVSRWDQRPACQVYCWTVRQSLPPIPIPLLPPDPDVWIDLGAVFRTTDEKGRYGRSIDYTAPPPVALDPARLAWVTERASGGAVV